MKIAILGGAGAMGGIFGALLAKGGNEVTLVDVAQAAVDKINAEGIYVELKFGVAEHVQVPATTTPATLDQVDVLVTDAELDAGARQLVSEQVGQLILAQPFDDVVGVRPRTLHSS